MTRIRPGQAKLVLNLGTRHCPVDKLLPLLRLVKALQQSRHGLFLSEGADTDDCVRLFLSIAEVPSPLVLPNRVEAKVAMMLAIVARTLLAGLQCGSVVRPFLV